MSFDENMLIEIKKELKYKLVESLSLDLNPDSDISDDEVLFGTGLGLDSLDAVEIVVLLQRNYGIEIKDSSKAREIFFSLDTLAKYICANRTK